MACAAERRWSGPIVVLSYMACRRTGRSVGFFVIRFAGACLCQCFHLFCRSRVSSSHPLWYSPGAECSTSSPADWTAGCDREDSGASWQDIVGIEPAAGPGRSAGAVVSANIYRCVAESIVSWEADHFGTERHNYPAASAVRWGVTRDGHSCAGS